VDDSGVALNEWLCGQEGWDRGIPPLPLRSFLRSGLYIGGKGGAPVIHQDVVPTGAARLMGGA
jgi:hypothetical protein